MLGLGGLQALDRQRLPQRQSKTAAGLSGHVSNSRRGRVAGAEPVTDDPGDGPGRLGTCRLSAARVAGGPRLSQSLWPRPGLSSSPTPKPAGASFCEPQGLYSKAENFDPDYKRAWRSSLSTRFSTMAWLFAGLPGSRTDCQIVAARHAPEASKLSEQGSFSFVGCTIPIQPAMCARPASDAAQSLRFAPQSTILQASTRWTRAD